MIFVDLMDDLMQVYAICIVNTLVIKQCWSIFFPNTWQGISNDHTILLLVCITSTDRIHHSGMQQKLHNIDILAKSKQMRLNDCLQAISVPEIYFSGFPVSGCSLLWADVSIYLTTNLLARSTFTLK